MTFSKLILEVLIPQQIHYSIIVLLRFLSPMTMQRPKVSYFLTAADYAPQLRSTILYDLSFRTNDGKEHQIQALGIDAITDLSAKLDLTQIVKIFTWAPEEVFD